MTEETIKGGDNGTAKEEVPVETKPVTDFKVAEIWIKSGQIHIEAVENFWNDKVTSLGILEVCKDIIKTSQIKKEEKEKIITSPGRIMDFVRSKFKRKGK